MEKIDQKKAAVIVVNWNGLRFLKNCLDSLFNQTYSNFDVYFVDNGSEDESVDFVQKNYPKTIIIKLDKNKGFAEGNNVAISKALSDPDVSYVITINNDTMANVDFLEKLVAVANEDENIGSVAPKMKFFHDKDTIDSVGILINKDGGGLSRGNKEKDRGQFDEKEEIFGVCAGAALYKVEMLRDVCCKNEEFFDNDFFAYYEDLDLAWRARLRGWKSFSCPQSVVYHIHSATSISYSPFKAYHVNRNRFFVIIKNFPLFMMIKALFILTPVRYLHLINSILKKKGPSHELNKKTNIFEPFKLTIKGWLSVIYYLPALFFKRLYIQKNKKSKAREVRSWFCKYSASIYEMIYK